MDEVRLIAEGVKYGGLDDPRHGAYRDDLKRHHKRHRCDTRPTGKEVNEVDFKK